MTPMIENTNSNTAWLKHVWQFAVDAAFIIGSIGLAPVTAQPAGVHIERSSSDTPEGLACAMPTKWVSGYINQPYPQTPLRVDATGVYTDSDRLYRLDLETGEVLWEHRLEGVDLYPRNDGVSALTLDDDTVYFGGYSGRVVAVDKLSGTERWHMDFENYIFRHLPVDDKWLYIRPRGGLYAVNKRTGEVKINFEIGGAPIIEGNKIYITRTDRAIALDKNTGEIVWETVADNGRGEKAYLSISDAVPYLYQGQMMIFSAVDNFAYSFDMKTGEQLWRFDDFNGGRAHVLWGQGDTVVFSSNGGKMVLFDIKKQEALWWYRTSGSHSWMPPYLYKGLIFLGSDSVGLYAVNYNTGKEVFRFKFPGEVRGIRAVVVQDDVVYFTTMEGNVRAHELKCPQLEGRKGFK